MPPAAHVLDVGCGNGLFLFILRQHGKLSEGVGLDVSAHETSEGCRALKRLGVDNIQLMAVKGFPDWPTDTFDVVSMIDVMHHVEPRTQRAFFREACARVSKGER